MAQQQCDPFAIDPLDFRTVADDTYDWESWLSPEGRLLWVNPSVQRITGFEPAACLAMNHYPLPIVHRDDRDRIAQLLKDALNKTSGNDLEFRIVRADGESRWVAMSWQSSHNEHGRWLGIRLSIRDIHRRKQLELELVNALDRAKAADRAKTQFLAMVSHELRTPLHCTSGYTELLLQGQITPEQRKYLGVIKEQNEALVHLVDSILELSASDHGALQSHRTTTHLPQLVRRLTTAFEPEAAAKKLHLDCEVDGDLEMAVNVDAKAVQHVLRNLLSNAIKFTRRGKVHVALRIHDIKGGIAQVSIAVSDTGLGIPAEQQERIYAPFVQADTSLAREHGGMGLGLTIARRFAELLDGRLDLASEVGKGSCFTLHFPAKVSLQDEKNDDSTGKEVVEHPGGRELPRQRVLVVDDSDANRMLMCEWLRTLGCEVQEVASGASALKAVRKASYELILMDIQMPGLDGTQTATRLRSTTGGNSPYLVALTANRFAKSDATVRQAGFDEVLVKPISLAELQAVLHRTASQDTIAFKAPDLSGKTRLDPTIVAELRAFGLQGEYPTLLHKLGQQVLEAQAGLVHKLEEQSASGHWQEVARIAHTIKGNCSLVGGTQASEIAAELIDSIEDGEAMTPHQVETSRLVEALQDFERQLRNAIAH